MRRKWANSFPSLTWPAPIAGGPRNRDFRRSSKARALVNLGPRVAIAAWAVEILPVDDSAKHVASMES